MITEQFLCVLKKTLILHLRVADNPKFGKQLYMTPFSYRNTMCVRRTLAPALGNYVFELTYFDLLEVFKSYCLYFFPILYLARVDGHEDLGYSYLL